MPLLRSMFPEVCCADCRLPLLGAKPRELPLSACWRGSRAGELEALQPSSLFGLIQVGAPLGELFVGLTCLERRDISQETASFEDV